MNSGMTERAKSDQILKGIISERAAKTQMMNLQLSGTSTMLTPPTIAF
jgi:hypothetical protein